MYEYVWTTPSILTWLHINAERSSGSYLYNCKIIWSVGIFIFIYTYAFIQMWMVAWNSLNNIVTLRTMLRALLRRNFWSALKVPGGVKYNTIFNAYQNENFFAKIIINCTYKSIHQCSSSMLFSIVRWKFFHPPLLCMIFKNFIGWLLCCFLQKNKLVYSYKRSILRKAMGVSTLLNLNYSVFVLSHSF